MRRRQFIAGLGAVAWPAVTRAQQPRMPVIGLLHTVQADLNSPGVPSIREGLAETGFIEGRNLAIEYRWAGNRAERLPELANDLVRRGVAAIGALGGAPAALAAKRATTAIPVVFAAPSNPVELGLVASLNRPGGNLTGVAGFTDELAAKRLLMLHQVTPNASVVGVLLNPAAAANADYLIRKAIEEAAPSLGLKLHYVAVDDENELEPAFASLTQQKVGALLATTSGPLGTWRYKIAALAARHRIPTIYARRDFVVAGGLMSYASSIPDLYRQAGVYLGRILKGEKPADLPVLQPTKIEFVINLNAAKSLGLNIPPGILALADEVIE